MRSISFYILLVFGRGVAKTVHSTILIPNPLHFSGISDVFTHFKKPLILKIYKIKTLKIYKIK